MKEISHSFFELRQTITERETQIKRMQREREAEQKQREKEGFSVHQQLREQTQQIEHLNDLVERMAYKHAENLERKVLFILF